ncbi:MAG: hypothetical protein LBE79_04480, partial [Tannerella sp.]|nr:hypothetical protein [Tannerella sp.]
INVNMKPLLVTFFAVILCYSLFIERREAPIHIDEINYTIQAESFDTLHVANPSMLYTANGFTFQFDFSE